MTVIAELDRTIQLLEALTPANPNSPANETRRRKLERDMARYFRALDKAFPYNKLTGIYNRYVKESLASDTKGILDPMLAAFDEELTLTVNGNLAEIYLAGSSEMITWGKTKGGVPIAFEGPPVSEAIKWAEKRGAFLVTEMDKETKKRLAGVISRGIENKRGVPGIARDIKNTFTDMTRFRSQLIARTETANALSQASLDRMKDMGVDGKEWITTGDDRVSDECRANEADGVIPRDDAFASGLLAPPQHPACRCSLAPARLKK